MLVIGIITLQPNEEGVLANLDLHYPGMPHLRLVDFEKLQDAHPGSEHSLPQNIRGEEIPPIVQDKLVKGYHQEL
jgi:hypothetical protein